MSLKKCVFGCEGKITLFSFPKNPALCKQWMQFVFSGRQRSFSSVFVDECFITRPSSTLEDDTGVNSQTSPVPLPQKCISSRPNPTKKLGENPVPFHSRKNDSHSLPLPCCVFFFFCRNLSVTVKI